MQQLMGKPDVSTYISYTDKAASAGNIDATANLADDQIFLFSGNADTTVNVRHFIFQTNESHFLCSSLPLPFSSHSPL